MAQTVVLTTMAVFQWFRIWGARSEDRSIFRQNPFSNLYLIATTAIVICLQVGAIYAPFMQEVLYTVPLKLSDWLLIIIVSFSVIIVDELKKFVVRFCRRSV